MVEHANLPDSGQISHFDIDRKLPNEAQKAAMDNAVTPSAATPFLTTVHTADDDAHHAKYTDVEAVAALEAAGLPEYYLDTTITVDLAIGEKIFWLNTTHYYERGNDAIQQVLVDAVDKTDDEGTVWDEADARCLIVDGSPVAALSPSESYVNKSLEDCVWWLERLVTTAAETWEVTVREWFIAVNPLHISAVKTTTSPGTTLDTASDWVHSGGYDEGSWDYSNVNALLISNCPAGYEIELWRWKTRYRNSSRYRRSRIWRPWLRMSPTTNGLYILPFDALTRSRNKLIGLSLYNPTTTARSPIKLAASAGKVGNLQRKMRAFV